MTSGKFKQEISSAVISRTDNIGDVILTLPLVNETGMVFENSEIHFAVKEETAVLLKHSPVRFETIAVADTDGLAERKNKLQNAGAQLAILARPDLLSASAFFMLGTKYRVGTAYRWYSPLFTDRVREHRKTGKKHESEYNLNLLRQFAGNSPAIIPEKLLGYTENELQQFRYKMKQFTLNAGNDYIVIHPGSRGSAFDISSEQFRVLAGKLHVNFPKLRLVYTGIDKELNKVSDSMPDHGNGVVLNLCGKLTLRELMILIDGGRLFISNSTGPIHIAGALNRKVLGFYPNNPPVNQERWKPLGKYVRIITPEDGSDNMESVDMDKAFRYAAEMIRASSV